jgi:colanic acid/amylovoran biosynthesis glycosyltransferase
VVLLLKIAYFINHYPKVSHSFIRREILALERQGFDVQRIALRGWDGPLPDEEDKLEQDRTRYVLRRGAWALLLPTLRVLVNSPRRFLRAVRLASRMASQSTRPHSYHFIYVAEACQILPWLAAFGAQQVHAHFGTNSAAVAMLAHVLGGPPYSFTVHGPEEFMESMGLEDKIRLCAFVVAVSSFGRSQLYLRSRFEDWPKIKVVHCGLEQAFYEVAPIPPPDTPRLVCVGRLCVEKGQFLLLEAATRLAANGVLFELVLAGDGPLRSEFEAQIEKYGLKDRVRITGWISSNAVRDEILAARALVLPTFAEGLPVVIMEAMALRRPVLATYVAGIPELVRSGVEGWLIPAGCIDSLTTAMEDCLTRLPAELQKIGDAGYNRVIVRHSIDTEAAKLAQCFLSATGTGNS